MANPLYGQNKADSDIALYGRGKAQVILNGGATVVLSNEDSGAYCIFDTAGASQFTLPDPDIGVHFTFISVILATSDHVIQSNTNDHGFLGGIIGCSTTAAKGQSFAAATDGNNDFITLDGATLGGSPGNRIEVVAILDSSAAKCWAVSGQTAAVGSSVATPFGDAQL